MLVSFRFCALAACALTLMSGSARAQRANEVAITNADDAFGTRVGNENTGLYGQTSARGFNPQQAGNVRLFGLYFDQQGVFGPRLVRSTSMRIGLAAQSFPFPAPTGIVDLGLYLPGEDTVVSVTTQYQTPTGFNSFGVDVKTPLIKEKLGLVAGVNALNLNSEWRGHSLSLTGAVLLRFTPNDTFEFIPYFYRQSRKNEEVQPFVYTSGAFLPPKYDRGTFFGQGWADRQTIDLNYGLFARSRPAGANWLLQGGLFRSTSDRPTGDVIFYRNTQADGTANLDILRYPEQDSASYSGEVRATGLYTQDTAWRQTIHLAVRGRLTDRLFGGGDTISFGPAKIGVYRPLPEPTFNPTTRDKDHVRQIAPGISYIGRWVGVAEASVGLQKAFYDRDYGKEGGAPAKTQSRPWLYNGTLAVFAARDLTVYAGYTRGLEEFGTAPDNAANRGEPMPAGVTKQIDAGVRYQIYPGMSIVAGVFDVTKPYFDRNAANIYTDVGALRHRGIELSFAGQVAEGLNVVAGAMFLRARVSGSPVDQGLLGPVPTGTTPRLFNLNVQYGPPSWGGLAVDAQLNGDGGGFANRLNTLRVSPLNTLALGARYPFTALDAKASLRVQVNNVMGTYTWTVDGASGRFTPSGVRNVSIRLAADF